MIFSHPGEDWRLDVGSSAFGGDPDKAVPSPACGSKQELGEWKPGEEDGEGEKLRMTYNLLEPPQRTKRQTTHANSMLVPISLSSTGMKSPNKKESTA